MKYTAKEPRALVLELLMRMKKNKGFSNITLDKALEESEFSEADRRFTSALFYGVLERRITLDYRISELASRPIADIDAETLNILRIGLYQLRYMDKVPHHAATNETVMLCSRKSAGFVNAILRENIRRKTMALPDKEQEPALYLSVRFSVCLPLCQKFISVYGFDRTLSIFGAFENIRQTTVRTNTMRITRAELAARLNGAVPTKNSPHGLHVTGAVRELYGFKEGLFFVQDEASQICTEVLGARSGETVIDACACPGSKSFGAAIDMQNDGRIYAYDLHAKKLSLIQSGAERLGIDIISAAEQDSRLPREELLGIADRVLCDVPCSGFGVLSKKPELRYKDPQQSENLPKVQLDILEGASKYLKRGGTLVYSTCTVFPEENQQNVHRFLSNNPDFSLCPFTVGNITADSGMITLLPDEHGTDGFFIAKLKKEL